MKIVLLADRKSANENNMSATLSEILDRQGYDAETVVLDSEKLKPCAGCFKCWVKTPGKCIIDNDGANKISEKLIRADAVILLSEITYGGFSADTKVFLDRSIPNLMPFFETYNNEMHHQMRYERFPLWLAVGYGDACEAEKKTFTELTERHALNMHPRKHLALTVTDAVKLTEKTTDIINFFR